MHITEAGLVERWKFLFRGEDKCTLLHQLGPTQRIITLSDTQILFYILGSGLSLAAILLMGEMIYSVFSKTQCIRFILKKFRKFVCILREILILLEQNLCQPDRDTDD